MRFVSTRHDACCGVASIAMVTGIGYDKIRKLIVPKNIPKGKFHGTTLEKALKTLTKLGKRYKVSFRKITFTKLKHNAYISINMPCGTRHAIVWNAKTSRIMDPSGFRCVTKEYARTHLNFIIEILE